MNFQWVKWDDINFFHTPSLENPFLYKQFLLTSIPHSFYYTGIWLFSFQLGFNVLLIFFSLFQKQIQLLVHAALTPVLGVPLSDFFLFTLIQGTIHWTFPWTLSVFSFLHFSNCILDFLQWKFIPPSLKS